MSTRDDVRRELKELAKLAEAIRTRKEQAVDAPPGAGEWSAFAATNGQAPDEASADGLQPRPSSPTVPPVSTSQPSFSYHDAGGVQNAPIYRRRPGLALALGATLVCAAAGTAAVGRSVLKKPPAVAAHGPALEEAEAKPTTPPAPRLESAANTPAKLALPEPVKASAVAPLPPAGGAAPSRPPPKPAIGRTGDSVPPTSSPRVSAVPRSAHAASSAEQSLDDLIRKAVAAPSR